MPGILKEIFHSFHWPACVLCTRGFKCAETEGSDAGFPTLGVYIDHETCLSWHLIFRAYYTENVIYLDLGDFRKDNCSIYVLDQSTRLNISILTNFLITLMTFHL